MEGESIEPVEAVPLRPPDVVMRLARMGAFHQTRLSFMRALLRRIAQEGWTFSRPVWRIDPDGVGVAVYRGCRGARCYSMVCFSHELDPEDRTDRVIAERWDATFTLFDGVPEEADIERLAANVPLQEAGRCTARELVLSRANKSVRLFEHVVERLAAGRQPNLDRIESVGYLMRTTAVYGNGKFGIADRDRIASRPELAGAFRGEMLAVWLIRAFTVDLAEHVARARSPESAVPLDRSIRRALGVGNSTGLGMAPFLMSHPSLLHAWIHARETALARVRSLPSALPGTPHAFTVALARARHQVAGWNTGDERQRARIGALGADLERLADHVEATGLAGDRPWDALYRFAEGALSLEGQELVVSLVIEPHGALVDDLADRTSADEDVAFRIDGSMSAARMRALIERDYQWALAVDPAAQGASARFWYVSEEKLEPRLGERGLEPGADREQPYAVWRDVAALFDALGDGPREAPLADLLVARPEHRYAARRVQITARFPYAEIRDNLIGAEMVPIDLLRCKLSFFGATCFDPRSDRWVRITMYKDAPYPDELGDGSVDDWAFPPARGSLP